jgi:hypothetical protein
MKPSAVDCRKNAVVEKQETRPSENHTDEQVRCWIGKAAYERKLCPPGICYVRSTSILLKNSDFRINHD